MLHLDENIEEQHPTQEDIIEDYVKSDSDFVNDLVKSAKQTKIQLNKFRDKLNEAKKANVLLAKYIGRNATFKRKY